MMPRLNTTPSNTATTELTEEKETRSTPHAPTLVAGDIVRDVGDVMEEEEITQSTPTAPISVTEDNIRDVGDVASVGVEDPKEDLRFAGNLFIHCLDFSIRSLR